MAGKTFWCGKLLLFKPHQEAREPTEFPRIDSGLWVSVRPDLLYQVEISFLKFFFKIKLYKSKFFLVQVKKKILLKLASVPSEFVGSCDS